MHLTTMIVLSQFLASPEASHCGIDLVRATGLVPGTLYPILGRLEKAGWFASEWEDGDPAEMGRPLRHYYWLTAEGTERALVARSRLAAISGLTPA